MTTYFAKKKIVPNPTNPKMRAAQFANAQLQLTDSYFHEKKQEFIQGLIRQGFNPQQVQELMENPQKGAASDQFDI